VQASTPFRRDPNLSFKSKVACLSSASEEDGNVIGTLGGRKIVQTGTVDSSAFYVKQITKGSSIPFATQSLSKANFLLGFLLLTDIVLGFGGLMWGFTQTCRQNSVSRLLTDIVSGFGGLMRGFTQSCRQNSVSAKKNFKH
jgi:hypothetical protein